MLSVEGESGAYAALREAVGKQREGDGSEAAASPRPPALRGSVGFILQARDLPKGLREPSAKAQETKLSFKP